MNPNNYNLYVFDVDWTLRETISGNTFPDHPGDWRMMAGRLEVLQALWEAEKPIVLATNQAGPAWRETTGKLNFPTAQECGIAMRNLLLGLPGYEASPPRSPILLMISLYDEHLARRSTIGTVYQKVQTELFATLDGMNALISYDPGWRKPQPKMLTRARNHYNIAPEQTLFVGDRENDQGAAQADGCNFSWAHEFFAAGQKEL